MDEHNNDSIDARLERAKDAALGAHSDAPSHIDEAAEAVGGVSGAIAGAAVGIPGGPVGMIVGGIVAAAGGWWAGRAASEAASELISDNDPPEGSAIADQSPATPDQK